MSRATIKSRKMGNPRYSVESVQVKTFVDEDGDWGYSVYSPQGDILSISSGEPSEKIAMREGKAEARFQSEILTAEGRGMRSENPSSMGLHLIQFPTGVWGFAGSIPNKLALVTKEGKQPTAEQFETARSFGPRLVGVKTRTWKTKTAALRAAKAEGYDPEKVKGHGLVPRTGPKRKTVKKTKNPISVGRLVAKALK